MISFVWSSKYPFISGCGGSENYTAGQIRELQRRGIECRILSIGHDVTRSQSDFPDISFYSIKSAKELEKLDDTIVFITYPLAVKTKHKSFVIMHCPPPSLGAPDPLYQKEAFKGKKLIAVSGMGAGLWRSYLKFGTGRIAIVYPFAENAFAEVDRPESTAKHRATKILFAGRLTQDKGIYTLLTALHMSQLKSIPLAVTVTDAGSHTEDGSIIHALCHAHPIVTVTKARQNAPEMAKLMAEHDIVVMPTTNIFWRETFGMVSVEGQHAGCRVVASRAGGLPETNCGGLLLASPDNPLSLAKNIAKAAELGPLTQVERAKSIRKFTVAKSVDSLLRVIGYPTTQTVRTPLPRSPLIQLPILTPPQLALSRVRSKR